MVRQRPRASSQTISTTRIRSSLVSAQNSPMVPVQNTPSIFRCSISQRMLWRRPGSSIRLSAVNGVVIAAHTPRNRSRAARLASLRL